MVSTSVLVLTWGVDEGSAWDRDSDSVKDKVNQQGMFDLGPPAGEGVIADVLRPRTLT